MQKRHYERDLYFKEQSITTEKYVIPFIDDLLPITSGLRIAEIGCGEGGNLKPFLDIGCHVVGIDIAANKIANANNFFSDHPMKDNLKLITKDIYKVNPKKHSPFDLIMLRDTIEHIYDQDAFMEHLKYFIKPSGMIFVGFPPWRNPFGGHQQICDNAFLSKLPYFHLLPNSIYPGILKIFKENEIKIKSLIEIKETGLSLNKFKYILKKRNYKIEKEVYYLINPNYEIKFKLKPRKLPGILNIPILRDYYTTAYYCVISIKK
jgi:2-polyprenyl-3-methyl-5-hydroxy-6-metoxy-1,4-benzoquinol methylase